jgi:hypothetical protein
MHEMGLRMLRVARVAWERCDVKQVLWVGDQLYADYPESQSLFDPEYLSTVPIAAACWSSSNTTSSATPISGW